MNVQEKKKSGIKKAGVSMNRIRGSQNNVGSSDAGFYVADKDGNISFASQSFAKILRYASKDEIVGLNLAEKLYEKKTDRQEFLKKLEESGQVNDYPVRMICKDGSRIMLSAHSALISDKDGVPVGVEGILEERAEPKTEKKSKDRKIPDLVTSDDGVATNWESLIKDPLTGLYSYQYFMTSLNSEIRRVERVFHPLCLMMIDLDDFAKYNEKCGREKGDELLKKVSEILKGTLLTTEIICRQAQDQFLVLLPETKRDDGLAIAKTVKDAIQNVMGESKMTCSIGMSRFIIGMTAQEFFLQANLGLYMAKESGKNEACLYG